jgi:hypothetical protein
MREVFSRAKRYATRYTTRVKGGPSHCTTRYKARVIKNSLPGLRFSVQKCGQLSAFDVKDLEHCNYNLEESRRILSRLKTLDPAVYQLLHLKDGSESEVPFRLILESSPTQHKSSECDQSAVKHSRKYLAVSYCWRNSDWSPLNGFQTRNSSYINRLPISDPIFREILRWKEPGEGIWIDTLCIKQKNKNEKTKAIASMDSIYKAARMVLVVLEDIEISGKEASLIKQIERVASSQRSVDNDSDFLDGIYKASDIWNLLAKIGSARWFKRAWCSHEFHLCQDAIFIMPCEQIEVKSIRLDTLQHILQSKSRWIHHSKDAYEDAKQNYSRVTLLLTSRFINYKSFLRSPPVQGISYLIQGLDSAKQCDKIAIALNLLGLRLYIDGEVRSEEDCKYILSLLALASADPLALCCTGPSIKSIISDDTGKPSDFSYVRWPHSSDLVHLSSRYPPAFQGLGNTVIARPEMLTIDALFFSGPVEQPTKSSLQRSKAFFEACWDHSSDIFEKIEPEEWSKPNLDRKTVFVENGGRYLACALDLGLHWMATCPQNIKCESAAKGLRPHTENVLDSLWPLVEKHLLILSGVEIFEADHENIKQNLLRFLEFFFRHLLVIGGDARYPAVIRLQEKGTAAVISLLTDSTNPVLALPLALAHPSFTFVKRAWLVGVLAQEEASYTLLGKVYLWGCGELKPNGKSIELKTRVKIFGVRDK